MPKFCDSCGNELKNENAKFCDKCGAEVKSNQNKTNSENISGVVCPKCGTTNPIGQKVCSNCGEDVLGDNTAAVVASYFCLWIFQLGSLIGGIYLLTRPNGKSKTQGLLVIVFMLLSWIASLIVGDYWYTFNDLILKYVAVPLIGTIIGFITWTNDFKILK